MKKIIALVSHKSDIKNILNSKKNKIIFIPFNNETEIELIKNKITYKSFKNYIDKEIYKKIDKNSVILFNKLLELKIDEKKIKEFFYYDNISLLDLIAWDILDDFNKYLFFFEIIKNILIKENPDELFFVGNNDLIVSSIEILSKIKKINTIRVEPSYYYKIDHFFLNIQPYFVKYLYRIREIQRKYRSKFLHKLNLDSLPLSEVKKNEKIHLDKNEFYKKFNLNPQKGIFTLTTQPLPKEENEQLLHAILNAMKKFPDKQLIIKLHPREVNKNFYRHIVDKFEMNNVFILKNIDTFDLLFFSELLITISSNTAFEAIILGKPVIIMNLSNKPERYPFIKNKVAIEVTKSKLLVPTINKILNDKKLKEDILSHRKIFISNYAYRIDGKSSERILSLLNSIDKEK